MPSKLVSKGGLVIRTRNQWVNTKASFEENAPFANCVDAFALAWMRSFKFLAYPGICSICGHLTLFAITDSNMRENVICLYCRSSNRTRQIHTVFTMMKKSHDVKVWNMENSGSLHERLLTDYGANYFYSAYHGEGIESGRLVNGIRHEDVRSTSFPDDYFDFVFSSDVLEHVPHPEHAFREIFRILKPGGRFIFTVPFLENEESNEERARVNDAGEVQFIKEPLYHGDPLRPEGILVFTLFGWNVLDMARGAGLDCSVKRLHNTCKGIIGPGAVVFMAVKPLTTP